MNRELLKLCRDTLQTLIECDDDPCQDLMRQVAEIETYLSKPEPEPVTHLKESRMHPGMLLPCHPGDLGGFPVYRDPPDQSARVAELQKEVDELGFQVADLQQDRVIHTAQLAALQAKREPLSETEIENLLGTSFDCIQFARAIEAAHGVTGGE